MKIVVERGTLLGALDHIRGIVAKRNTIPILENLLLEGKSGSITFKVTDLDMEIVETVSAAVQGSGKITVQAGMLHEIVRKMPDGAQISLEHADHKVIVKAGRSRFELGTLPAEDFPHMAMDDLPNRFTIPAPVLLKALQTCKWSISTEETRYYLNGVCFHANGDRLFFVSTDGHRLTRHDIPMPDGAAGIGKIILPRRAAQELSKLLDGVTSDVEVAASETKLTVAFGAINFRTKLIDGNFPPYERVIPTNNAKALEADARAMAVTLDRVCVVMADRANAVKLGIDGDGITFTARNPNSAAESTDSMDADYKDSPLEIGFNGRYLGEMLSQLGSPKMRMLLEDAGSPALIEPVGDPGTIYVLMPLRF